MRITTPLLTVALLATTVVNAQDPTLVRDFYPGSSGAFVNHGRPNGFRIHDGKLLLFAMDGIAVPKLFALDDLSGGVQELAQVGNVQGYTTTNGGIIASEDRIYFFAQQSASINSILWCAHGGSVVALDTIPYQVLFYFTGIPLPGGGLIFPSSDPAHGYEPWVTDGTVEGTHLLKDINPGTGGSLGSPFPLFQGFDFGGSGYFMAGDPAMGQQLWKSDGTEAGTQLFMQVNEPSATGAIALRYSKNGERFIVSTPTGLVASDGDAANNTVLNDAEFALAHTAGLTYPEASGDGWMYFTALEDQWTLYRTRGTAAATEPVFAGTPNLGYLHLTELNGRLYAFIGDNEHVQLVQLDPGTQTSSIVKTFAPDPNSGPNPGAFYGFRNDGTHFYFMGKEGSHARQYWMSDGTEAGTRMIHEFMPTYLNGGPDAADGNMIMFQGSFVFSANDADVGLELWASEGVAGIADAAASEGRMHAWYDGTRIQVQSLQGLIRSVRVLDTTGRVLLQQGGTHNERLAVDLPTRSAGTYLVQVTTEQGTGVVRVAVF